MRMKRSGFPTSSPPSRLSHMLPRLNRSILAMDPQAQSALAAALYVLLKPLRVLVTVKVPSCCADTLK